MTKLRQRQIQERVQGHTAGEAGSQSHTLSLTRVLGTEVCKAFLLSFLIWRISFQPKSYLDPQSQKQITADLSAEAGVGAWGFCLHFPLISALAPNVYTPPLVSPPHQHPPAGVPSPVGSALPTAVPGALPCRLAAPACRPWCCPPASPQDRGVLPPRSPHPEWRSLSPGHPQAPDGTRCASACCLLEVPVLSVQVTDFNRVVGKARVITCSSMCEIASCLSTPLVWILQISKVRV